MMRATHFARLGLLALMPLAACAGQSWLARDAFGSKYACPKAQVREEAPVEATNADGTPLPGFSDIYVHGCEEAAVYRCHNAADDRGGVHNECSERPAPSAPSSPATPPTPPAPISSPVPGEEPVRPTPSAAPSAPP